jgi:GTP:adenosylcobinamide-phosphate guanylyltransferase
MYLGKKVLVIPMLVQYEQHCNAAGARSMGATVIPTLEEKYYNDIRAWLENGTPIQVAYPDITEKIVNQLVTEHAPKSDHRTKK